MEKYCKHCGHKVHTPDDKTGLIHTNNLYACYDGKKRLETVAS